MRQLTPWTGRTGLPKVNIAVGASLALLRRVPSYVGRAQRAGARVHVWTVNRPEDMEFALSLGVDAVITDHRGRSCSGSTATAPGQPDLVFDGLDGSTIVIRTPSRDHAVRSVACQRHLRGRRDRPAHP